MGFTRKPRVYRRDAIRFQGLDAILGGWMNWLCGTDSLDRMWLRNQSHGFYEEVPRVSKWCHSISGFCSNRTHFTNLWLLLVYLYNILLANNVSIWVKQSIDYLITRAICGSTCFFLSVDIAIIAQYFPTYLRTPLRVLSSVAFGRVVEIYLIVDEKCGWQVSW